MSALHAAADRYRAAALRCLGNAVVPQVAEAFCLGLLDGRAAA